MNFSQHFTQIPWSFRCFEALFEVLALTKRGTIVQNQEQLILYYIWNEKWKNIYYIWYSLASLSLSISSGWFSKTIFGCILQGFVAWKFWDFSNPDVPVHPSKSLPGKIFLRIGGDLPGKKKQEKPLVLDMAFWKSTFEVRPESCILLLLLCWKKGSWKQRFMTLDTWTNLTINIVFGCSRCHGFGWDEIDDGPKKKVMKRQFPFRITHPQVIQHWSCFRELRCLAKDMQHPDNRQFHYPAII